MDTENESELIAQLCKKYSEGHFAQIDQKIMGVALECAKLFEKNGLTNLNIDRVIRYIEYIRSQTKLNLSSLVINV